MPLSFGTPKLISSSSATSFPEPKTRTVRRKGDTTRQASSSRKALLGGGRPPSAQREHRSTTTTATVSLQAQKRPQSAASTGSITMVSATEDQRRPSMSSSTSLAISQMAYGGKKNNHNGEGGGGRRGVAVRNSQIPPGAVAAPFIKANGSIVVPQRRDRRPHQRVFEGEVLLAGPSTSIAPSPTVTHLSEFFPTPSLNMSMEMKETKKNRWFWRNQVDGQQQSLEMRTGGDTATLAGGSRAQRGQSTASTRGVLCLSTQSKWSRGTDVGDLPTSMMAADQKMKDRATTPGGLKLNSSTKNQQSAAGRGRIGTPLWQTDGEVNYSFHTLPPPLADVLDGARLRPASAAALRRPASATAAQRSVNLHHKIARNQLEPTPWGTSLPGGAVGGAQSSTLNNNNSRSNTPGVASRSMPYQQAQECSVARQSFLRSSSSTPQAHNNSDGSGRSVHHTLYHPQQASTFLQDSESDTEEQVAGLEKWEPTMTELEDMAGKVRAKYKTSSSRLNRWKRNQTGGGDMELSPTAAAVADQVSEDGCSSGEEHSGAGTPGGRRKRSKGRPGGPESDGVTVWDYAWERPISQDPRVIAEKARFMAPSATGGGGAAPPPTAPPPGFPKTTNRGSTSITNLTLSLGNPRLHNSHPATTLTASFAAMIDSLN